MRREVTVYGTAEITWAVTLPETCEHDGQLCENPAVEAVIEALPEFAYVYLWGEQEEAARVQFDVYEDDVVIDTHWEGEDEEPDVIARKCADCLYHYGHNNWCGLNMRPADQGPCSAWKEKT